MLCNDVQDLLAVYLDGGIDDPTTQADIERHLESCADCRAERDSLALTLKQIAPVIKAAGDAIRVPDAQPNRVRSTPMIRRSVIRLPFNSNHKDRDKPMMNNQQPPTQRRISALNGVMTFALSLILLVFVWLIFNGIVQRSPAGGGDPNTVTPENAELAVDPTSTEILADLPTQAPTETATAAPTVDPLATTGGFTENAIDASTLPEYTLPNGGGGGGGGGGGCPDETDASQTVKLMSFNMNGMLGGHTLCLYDLPEVVSGSQFEVTMTSPTGKEYSSTFNLQEMSELPEGTLGVVREASDTIFYSTVYTEDARHTVWIEVYFPAVQEFGDWDVQASQADQVFASGTVTVSTSDPIYSVSRSDLVINPFEPLREYMYQPGDRLILAARGLEPERSLILALYSNDPERVTDTTMVMIAYYARQVTVSEDGSYQVEFVVGTETLPTWYSGVFDPQPDAWLPVGFGFTVGMEQP